mmetsp:Transcript_4921/g.16106  ORF Transcript_4921/g.16106 Transcript_4921/m.16106 type:complete len:229 (-) Transcript_4921:422-1108(-)
MTLGGARLERSACNAPNTRVDVPSRAMSPQTNVVVDDVDVDVVDDNAAAALVAFAAAPSPMVSSTTVVKKRRVLFNNANRVAGFCAPTPRCTDDPVPTPPSSPRRNNSPKCPNVLAGACAATSAGAASSNASNAAGASFLTPAPTCVSAAPTYKINVFANGASPCAPSAGTTPRRKHSRAALRASRSTSASRSPTRSTTSTARARIARGNASAISSNAFNPSHLVLTL